MPIRALKPWAGKYSIATAVRLVVREQERNKPINYQLFRHALQGIALPGYKAAYEAVAKYL